MFTIPVLTAAQVRSVLLETAHLVDGNRVLNLEAALAWSHQKAIISGASATTLNPTGTATRAQVAAIVMRYAQSAAK